MRLIFYMYLDGYTCQEIADTLTEFGQRTKKGNTVWSPNSILQILQNERHCGDVLARKTWTPSFLDHKSRKNNQDRNQYRKKNHHDAIISRDDFIAVQRLISNAKYGNKGFLPELRVVPEGVLRGYVTINPRWAGFKVDDYYEACDSVDAEPNMQEMSSNIEAQSGDFDLRGYEVARAQFFDTTKLTVTFSTNDIRFSATSIRKFENCLYIELLIHPRKRIFAVRQSSKDNRNHMQWAKMRNGFNTTATGPRRQIWTHSCPSPARAGIICGSRAFPSGRIIFQTPASFFRTSKPGDAGCLPTRTSLPGASACI
ncbi:MAG: recombinase family protein [Oscillospiraceae bacterium]|nr:recombinase family protein [Oscillospiraceae bacterium]